ncbi:MAG: putative Ig domain-containing protein [Nannocystis sp.]|nr:Ig domain-containing protein [Nannocystis sp.]MBA3549583.1 putative Ig domain-containing protein [Nannocystis sp.]
MFGSAPSAARILLLCPLWLLACSTDEDVGGSGGPSAPPTTDPDPTTSTTTPTSSDSSTDGDATTIVPTSTGEPDSTTGTTEVVTTGPGPEPLTVDCKLPPAGAKAAQYSHQPGAAGGVPGYTWTAMGLPAGLAIDAGSGEISGIPEESGAFAFELIVTDTEGVMAQTSCPAVMINDQLGVDLDAMTGPCITAGESITDYLIGGDGTAIECVAPQSLGDGVLPAGITIDKATCEITGTITETRYGTWAWIVRARQSGVDVYAPYCATQDKQAAKAYKIVGSHSGKLDNELEPLTLPIKIADQLRFDGDADPAFVVDKGSCGNSCFFGFAYKVSPSPFGTGDCAQDKDKCFGLCPLIADVNQPDGDTQIGCSLVPAMGAKTGFAHEMWAKGDVPPVGFATRPFILQWSVDYCLSDMQAQCAGKAAILTNGDGSNLEFPIIIRPQP